MEEPLSTFAQRFQLIRAFRINEPANVPVGFHPIDQFRQLGRQGRGLKLERGRLTIISA